MKRRWLSILLTLCMMLTLLPPGAVFAAEADNGPADTLGVESSEGTEASMEEDGIMPLTTVDDHTPPTVTGVYMNSPGGTVTVGDKLEFTISAEDESGIYDFWTYLYFDYECEQGHTHSVTANMNSYDEEAKLAKLSLTINDSMVNGTYKLSGVSVGDTHNNRVYYDTDELGNIDFENLTFTIEGTSFVEDHTSPTVAGVYMNSPGATITVGDKLEFTISAEDESGIYDFWTDLYFDYECEQGHTHRVTANMNSYDEETKLAKLSLTINDSMVNGTYKLSGVSVGDTHNNRVYYDMDEPETP